jgi:hypothetical protein
MMPPTNGRESMIQIQTNSNAMKRAAERAISKPLKVRMIEFRTYSVLNGEGKRYTVYFRVGKNGSKWAECSCAAGMAGQLCYHVAGALPIHCHVAKHRQQ